MDRRRHILLITAGFFLLVLLSATVQARPSELSRWLSLEAGSELQRELEAHPRYADQQIVIAMRTPDALAQAVARVLQSRLQDVARVALQRPGSAPPPPPAASIDALSCGAALADYRLEVSVSREASRGAVELAMVEVYGGALVRRWSWQGNLNRAERDRAAQRLPKATHRGSLDTPWSEAEVASAAGTLSADLVCALRPHIAGITGLHWEDPAQLPTALADTVSASRHYVGNWRELEVNGNGGSYRVEASARRFAGGVWQLWLNAVPRESGRPGVQAVTYMRADSGLPAPPVTPAGKPTSPVQSVVASVVDLGRRLQGDDRAADHLEVELLGATRSGYGLRADLNLRLRLRNTAPRPLAFGLKSSGGHFERCIGSSEYYRHDAWGRLSGVLRAGEERTEYLRISGVRHRPGGVAGRGVCAGFRDLAAFEDYPRRGARVTDYVRWHM